MSKPTGTFLTLQQIEDIKILILKNKTSIRKLAPLMMLGASTLCNKLNGKEELKSTEMAKLAYYLGIEINDIPKYFFNPQLHSATKTA